MRMQAFVTLQNRLAKRIKACLLFLLKSVTESIHIKRMAALLHLMQILNEDRNRHLTMNKQPYGSVFAA